jgi:predicted nucleotidyltransferase
MVVRSNFVSFWHIVGYRPFVRANQETLSLAELQSRLRPFCERHPIRRLEIFGSAARGEAGAGSDVDLLVTLEDSAPVSTAELLEMAGEVEEVLGAPVDFVLSPSLEKSPNRFAREHILSTAVCIYGG